MQMKTGASVCCSGCLNVLYFFAGQQREYLQGRAGTQTCPRAGWNKGKPSAVVPDAWNLIPSQSVWYPWLSGGPGYWHMKSFLQTFAMRAGAAKRVNLSGKFHTLIFRAHRCTAGSWLVGKFSWAAVLSTFGPSGLFDWNGVKKKKHTKC